MIDFFKKHSFVIGTFSLGISTLLGYLSPSKLLILPFIIIAFLGFITQVYVGLNKKKWWFIMLYYSILLAKFIKN